MDIRPIRNEEDYDWALAEITPYFDNQPEPGTREADRFDILADLIGAYESRRWHIEAPDPVQAIKAYMELSDRKQGELAEVLESKSRASEVLNYKRPLTVEMVHHLSSRWKMPAEVLVAPYHLRTTSTKKMAGKLHKRPIRKAALATKKRA